MRSLTPQPPEWIDTAAVQADATREVAATPDEVFAALADHETWPEWFTALSKVERFGELHEGVGSNRRVHIGSKVSIEEEFNIWEPGQAWGFTIIAASIPGLRSMNERVTIEAVGTDRSRVTYLMGIDPQPWLRPLVVLARRRLTKELSAALEGLDAHIARSRHSA